MIHKTCERFCKHIGSTYPQTMHRFGQIVKLKFPHWSSLSYVPGEPKRMGIPTNMIVTSKIFKVEKID